MIITMYALPRLSMVWATMLMSGSNPMILIRGPITWFFWVATVVTVFAITRSLFAKTAETA